MTVWPSVTSTLATVPDAWKDAVTSRAAATEPVAVIVLLTVPCCTVEVSWVEPEADEAVGGLMTKYAPTIAATTMTPREELMMTRLLSCIGEKVASQAMKVVRMNCKWCIYALGRLRGFSGSIGISHRNLQAQHD